MTLTDIEQAIERAHPAANLFPMLSDAEVWELANDIGAKGLVEPIVIHEGLILDGRNRWVACIRAGVGPRTRFWEGEGGSPLGYVISKNLQRRHLEPGQRAAIAAEALPMFEAEAKSRQGARTDLQERIPESEPGRQARDDAAEQFEVNPHYISDAKRLKEQAPGAFARLKAGEITIPEAKREAAGFVLPEREQASPEERAYYSLSRQRMVVSLDPATVAGFCADAELSAESFQALETWLRRFNEALSAVGAAPLRVVR